MLTPDRARALMGALSRHGREVVDSEDLSPEIIQAEDQACRHAAGKAKMEANNAAMKARAREAYQNDNQIEMFK